MKNILITGGRGFIGMNLILLWKRLRPEYNLIEVDAETYADKYKVEQKNELLDRNSVPRFVIDLSKDDAEEALMSIVETFDIDTVVHCASESHVDNSINGPMKFFQSNVIGTATVLEVVRKKDLRFHLMSTDEVLGVTRPENPVSVESRLLPSSPYSSSKASQELLVHSYEKTFNIRATISRCCNNFGKFQQSEKFIPTIIRNLENKTSIPVYGDGMQFRQWIHVDDHNRAILDILEAGECEKIYHISSNEFGYMSNMDIIKILSKEYGKSPKDVVEFVKDRPGHDTSYYITNYTAVDYGESHIKDTLIETLDWYRMSGV